MCWTADVGEINLLKEVKEEREKAFQIEFYDTLYFLINGSISTRCGDYDSLLPTTTAAAAA